MIEDIRSIMEESPDGSNPSTYEVETLAEGFTIVDPTRLSSDAGMTAHRGVLQADEYVDPFVLREAAEAALGFTYAAVTAAYKGGRPSAEQRQLRDRIDSRLLALSHAGTNIQKLADVLGLNESTVDRALRRARETYVAPQVKNPAVITPRMCFIHGTMDAKPRRRSHRGCPAGMLPLPQYRDSTINLSDRAYDGRHR